MNIKLQKLNHKGLKKLSKVDENNNLVEGQAPLYVRLEEVESNLVNTDATPLTEEVFNNINWKDEQKLVFTNRQDLPNPVAGICQIVALDNGQVWAVPGANAQAFKLGSDDLSLYLKKKFLQRDEVVILGSVTKIGALPGENAESQEAKDSTYLEFNDNSIKFVVNGIEKYLLDNAEVTLQNNDNCVIAENDSISLKLNCYKANQQYGIFNLREDEFTLSVKDTTINFDLANSKFNCYTNLNNAVYGTSNIYLEFNPENIKVNYVENVNNTKTTKTLFKVDKNGALTVSGLINSDGEIHANGAIYSSGSIYANGSNRVIDASNINNYIKNYFDANFENRFKTLYRSYSTERVAIFSNCSMTEINYNIENDPALFQIDFSNNSNSNNIMSIFFHGVEINNLEKIYKKGTLRYYLVKQNHKVNEDDEEYDNITVNIYDNEGDTNFTTAYIRGFYRFQRS